MKINEALNLVIPLFDDEGNISSYVHAVPFSRSTFEVNYKLLSTTFSSVYTQGLGAVFGPRVSLMILRDIAKDRNIDPEPLLNEIKRLCTFIGPGSNGWEGMPLHTAIVQSKISEDDTAEVMNALVFFIAGSALLPKIQIPFILPDAMRIWGAATISLTSSAWIASLTTSTVTATTTATAPSATSGNPAGEAPPEVRRIVMVNGRPT